MRALLLSAWKFRSGGPWMLLACLCATSFAFMAYASLGEPATMDELAHLPASYAYVHELDYRLNPEHPPLLKALAGLPLLFLQPEFPTDHPAWTSEVNGQWVMGGELLYHAGNDPDAIVRAARIAPMLLTVLLIILVYVISRRFLGNVWALVPAALTALSPTVLAHGHYVTTDVAAAFGVLLATHFFLNALDRPSLRNIFLAGIGLGIAELMKFSAILLLPFFGLLAVVHFLIYADGVRGVHWRRLALRRLWNLVLIGIIAYVIVVYPVYFVLTLNYPIERQVSDTQFILGSFNATEVGCNGFTNCLAVADLWMAGSSLLRPFGHYLLGLLMVIQRASGGNVSYFLGEVSSNGSPWYFPVVYLLKESLPALMIILAALVGGAIGGVRRLLQKSKPAAKEGRFSFLKAHFAEFALLLFALIYWTYSVRSTLNIGVRHLMPVIPVAYILAAAVWRGSIRSFRLDLDGTLRGVWKTARSVFGAALKVSLLCALLLWTFFETAFAAPRFLSYFNQFGGGTNEGYRFVTDSNYDWGQDLLRLEDFLDAHPEIDRIAVEYFGGGLPSHYLGNRSVNWSSRLGSPTEYGIRWFAISINFLQNSIQPAKPDYWRAPEDEYGWLTGSREREPGMGGVPVPDYRVGTSIFVYHL